MLKLSLVSLLLATASIAQAEQLLISGSVEAKESQVFSVPSASSWRLQIKWMAEEGTKVNRGDTVVMYDTASLTSQIEQKKSLVRKAVAEAKRSELKFALEVREAEHRYEVAKLRQEKAALEARLPEGQITKLKYAQNQLDLKKAINETTSAKEALSTKKLQAANEEKRHELEVSGANKNLQRDQLMLSNMEQKAKGPGTVQYVDHPWDGTKIRMGDTVQRGFTVLKIPSTDDLEVTGWLNEVDIARVTLGQSVTLSVDAIPDVEFSGKIEQISNQAESRQSWGESSYFALKISMDNQQGKQLIPGMSVLAEVKVN